MVTYMLATVTEVILLCSEILLVLKEGQIILMRI